MGKIYSGIGGLSYEPDYANISNLEELVIIEEAYVEAVKAACRDAFPDDPYSGKELLIPFADGHARYVVLRLKPVELIHLNVGDAWDAPYVHRLTAKDIKSEINYHEQRQRMFEERRKENEQEANSSM